MHRTITQPLVFVRLAVWGLAIFGIVWLLDKNFVFSGRLTVTYEPGRPSRTVTNFASKEPDRLLGTKNENGAREQFQVLTQSPLYFDVTLPRRFASATLRLTYQNPDQQPEVRAAIVQQDGTYSYRDLAFAHPTLEALPEEWERVQDGTAVLWQKNNAYLKAKRVRAEKLQPQREEYERERNVALAAIQRRIDKATVTAADAAGERDAVQRTFDEQIAALETTFPMPERPAPPFSTVDDFLRSAPSPEVTLQYNYDLADHLLLPAYAPRPEPRVFSVGLRGRHEIETYLGKGERLSFSLLLQDINRTAGTDDVHVTLYRGGAVVLQQERTKLGNPSGGGQPSEEFSLDVVKDRLPEDVYRIVIEAPHDILIKKITTSQRYLMFRGSLYLTESDEYREVYANQAFQPVTLFTTVPALSLVTAHERSLQTVTVGERPAALRSIHTAVTTRGLEGLTRVTIPRGDVQLYGDGLFVFSPDDLFVLPTRYANLTESSDLARYDSIIANYPQARQEGEWLVAETTFDQSKLNMDKQRQLHFIIALPDLHEQRRLFKVRRVEMVFQKPPVTVASLGRRLTNLFRK